MPVWVKEAYRTPNRQDQNRTSPWHIIVKALSTEKRNKNIESFKGKLTSHLYRQTHPNNSRFLKRNRKSKEDMK
jgi:hypothetical protein